MATQPQGIDVSSHNPNIDWPTVKERGALDFAFIKRSQGTGYLNPLFPSQWQGAKQAGLLRGAYHFFQWDVEPVAQAQHFISSLNGDYGELPCTVDIENTGDGAGPRNYNNAEAVRRIRAFVHGVNVATGKPCIIYTYPSMWRDTLGNPTTFTDCPLWLASYTPKAPKPVGGWSALTFWQYHDKGVVPGVPGIVDVDLFMGRLEQLRTFAGISPAPDTYTDPVTGFTVSHGFLAYWRNAPYLGHPLTNEFAYTLENGEEYIVQLFERGLLHWRMGEQVGEARVGQMWGVLAHVLA